MRNILLVLAVVGGAGCQRFMVRTMNRVSIDGPVDTRLTDITPVSPIAGPVRPVVVEQGNSAGRVAIVDVDGLILNTPFVGPLSVGENPVALFREKLAAIEADPCAKAVVLRVNSHGGGVAACMAMRRDLERFKARTGKPVVACLLDTATGGACYLASVADQVVAGPATVTGGLGVILNLFNLQDLMAQFNVIPQPIKSGSSWTSGLRPARSSLRKGTSSRRWVTSSISNSGRISPGLGPGWITPMGRCSMVVSSPGVKRKPAALWTESVTLRRLSRSRHSWAARVSWTDPRSSSTAGLTTRRTRYMR